MAATVFTWVIACLVALQLVVLGIMVALAMREAFARPNSRVQRILRRARPAEPAVTASEVEAARARADATVASLAASVTRARGAAFADTRLITAAERTRLADDLIAA